MCIRDRILTVLTGGIHKSFSLNAGFDVAALLQGTEPVTTGLLQWLRRSTAHVMAAVPVWPVYRTVREEIHHAFVSVRGRLVATGSDVPLFALLLAGRELVYLQQPEDMQLSGRDLLLLSNLVNCSESLKSGESWLPICLSDFHETGFLYSYVCFLDKHLPLILLSGDPNSVGEMKAFRHQVERALGPAISQLSNPTVVSDCCVPGLMHLVVKDRATAQLVMPVADSMEWWENSVHDVIRSYMVASSQMSHPNRLLTEWVEAGPGFLTYGWAGVELEIYASFRLPMSKQRVGAAMQDVLDWAMMARDELFVLLPSHLSFNHSMKLPVAGSY
eukprot:TRINITY_DN50506_c0_g1_i1.p1 TRINITY_DN50506_c0_g1~~TRINITY_DN50506_c0_g1_i1.p1  ORF type:complete len:331 (+),score=49.95 TRINITY_DN50506_c0_g1_i1:121-1113(+)